MIEGDASSALAVLDALQHAAETGNVLKGIDMLHAYALKQQFPGESCFYMLQACYAWAAGMLDDPAIHDAAVMAIMRARANVLIQAATEGVEDNG